MRLWSIQSPRAAALLEAGSPLTGAPDFEMTWGWSADHPWGFKQAYDWMRRAMAERVGSPPADGAYPVWAWARPPSITRSGAPDMRAMRDSEPCALLEIEVDPERVLLSDHESWHMVLNGSALALTEELDQRQDARLAELCQKLGLPLDPGGRLGARHYGHPDVLAFLSDGWSSVFEVEPLAAGRPARMAFSRPFDPEWIRAEGVSVQACLWRVNPVDVVSVRHFGARPRARSPA